MTPSPANHPKPKPAPATTAGDNTSLRHLTLVRGEHRWTFACDDGGRGKLISALERLARKPGCPLDRFDVCLIERHLTTNKKAA